MTRSTRKSMQRGGPHRDRFLTLSLLAAMGIFVSLAPALAEDGGGGGGGVAAGILQGIAADISAASPMAVAGIEAAADVKIAGMNDSTQIIMAQIQSDTSKYLGDIQADI